MLKGQWLTAKDVLRVNAFKYANKVGIKDLNKSYTFKEWNERTCRLANALADLGLKKGDRFAALGYNCVEWMEIYAVAAKGGFIVVPLMFRLAAPEMEYILNHCEAKAIIVQDQWIDHTNGMKKNLTTVEHYISFGVENPKFDGYLSYEDIIAKASPEEPDVEVNPEDPWAIMYTGGTTGLPKGVVKSHEACFAQYFIEIFDHDFKTDDVVLLVMPCCHVNSLYNSFPVTWIGGTVMAYNMVSFSPEDLLKTFSDHGVTFTSLVPTHYIMLLALPDEVKKKYNLTTIKKLLISSAPARRDTKLGVLEMFPNSELYEAYGSTEAGIVTVLKPNEQLTKLGSCGREVIGSDLVKLYDDDGNVVTEPHKVGELYSRSPMLLSGYWKAPEKMEQSMKGNYFTSGDLGMRDEEGYIFLVDRKANMIISGGENIFPSEVENVIGGHEKVKDIAVIGVPHEKWGETVLAIIVLHEGQSATAEEIGSYCRGKLAGYKIPKQIEFIKDEEMPRSGAGKILHRILREKYGMWGDQK
jgi:acyl-CoA synthetase (AMP-forming)/AMP-acid ligase II